MANWPANEPAKSFSTCSTSCFPKRTASRSAATCGAGAWSPPSCCSPHAPQESEKVFGLDLGADDYVTKPYSPRELRAASALCCAAASLPRVMRMSFASANASSTSAAELRCAGRAVATTRLA